MVISVLPSFVWFKPWIISPWFCCRWVFWICPGSDTRSMLEARCDEREEVWCLNQLLLPGFVRMQNNFFDSWSLVGVKQIFDTRKMCQHFPSLFCDTWGLNASVAIGCMSLRQWHFSASFMSWRLFSARSVPLIQSTTRRRSLARRTHRLEMLYSDMCELLNFPTISTKTRTKVTGLTRVNFNFNFISWIRRCFEDFGWFWTFPRFWPCEDLEDCTTISEVGLVIKGRLVGWNPTQLHRDHSHYKDPPLSNQHEMLTQQPGCRSLPGSAEKDGGTKVFFPGR